MTDHALPVGDRDQVIARRRGETDSAYLRRLAIEEQGMDPGDLAIAARDADCTCRGRGIVCGHEPSFEERMEQLYGKPARDMSDLLAQAGREDAAEQYREQEAVRTRRRGGKKSQLELRIAALEKTLNRLRPAPAPEEVR